MDINKIKKVLRGNETQDYTFPLLIPSWNNLEYLKLCMKSIRQNSSHKHQIIVLINEGKDGSLAWVQKQKDINYVYTPENLGICYGLNMVQTDYTLYINDDMYVLPDWDDVLLKEIRKIGHTSFILSATEIESYDINNTCDIAKNYSDNPENFKEDPLLLEFRQLKKADWSVSTWPPVLVPAELWDLVGGMSVEFSPDMYSDPDLFMKLWQTGVKYYKRLWETARYITPSSNLPKE